MRLETAAPCPGAERRARLRDASGFSLIELVISIAIIGIAVSGTLMAIARTTRSSADPMVVKQAVSIAEAYAEEIMLNPFYDPDTGSGGGVCPAKEASRPLYDNVCDYDALSDTGAEDQGGNAIAGLENYTITVAVEENTATLGALTGNTVVERVDVTVTHSTGLVSFTLSSYKTNY